MCCGKARVRVGEKWWQNVLVEKTVITFGTEEEARKFLEQDAQSLPARQWLLHTVLDFRRRQVEQRGIRKEAEKAGRTG
jgi:hypothetical protein